jgi:restriction endonuclease S subunit
MSDEWQTMPLSEAVLINPQVTLKKGTNYPFIDMQSVMPNTNKVRASEHKVFSGGGSRFLAGDVLMARITPSLENGKISRFVSDDSSTLAHGSTEFIVIRGKPNITDTAFAYYLMRWDYVRQYAISQMTGTSGRQRVPTECLQYIDVPIPSIVEQRAIAEFLNVLDDKIELNHRIDTTLRQIIKAMFKSWFIDFDLTGDTSLGWKTAKFGDFLTSLTNRIGGEEAPEYSATVNGLSLRDESFNATLSKSKEKNKKIVKNNLVFGLSRQTLNFGVMKEDIGSVSPVYEIFDIDINTYLPELLEMFIRLKMNEHIDILKPAAREGQAIDRNYLLSKEILVPDIKIQKRYQELCAPFYEMIAQNEKESRTLASLRDGLLPKLMRGEVRVKS